MEASRYLIAGGGLAADAACKGIRQFDPEGSITLVGEEAHRPYARPPLSKALWKGASEDSIWRETEALRVALRLGRRIVAVDLESREALDDHGVIYSYEKLLFATGGRPRHLPFGGDEVIYFRTVDDYRRLRALADGGARFVVIGGGFIGSEIAAALVTAGSPVTMIVPEAGIGSRIFPAALASALNDYYRERGVEVLTDTSVVGIEQGRVTLENGRTLTTDSVVAGIGITPNVEVAASAGLPVSNGIVVDEFGRAGDRNDVFAAGDVARFPSTALGGELRVEHEDHAKSHGRLVGANMAGAETRYEHLPFFYSDLFDLGYEAVGDLDPEQLTIVTDWSGLSSEAPIYYVDGERRPRGVLLWNLFGQVDAARELVRAGAPVARRALAARAQ